MVTDRLQERSSACMTYGQQSNLIVKMNKSFNNYSAGTGTSAFLRNVPCHLYVCLGTNSRLTVPGRRHDRFYHTRNTYLLYRSNEFVMVVRKFVRCCRQMQFLGRHTTYRLAVHGEESSLGRRDDTIAFLLQFYQSRSGNSFYFGNNQRRLLCFNNLTQAFAVQHIEHVRAMRYLHSRCIRITVTCDYFYAVALKLNGYFFSQLAATE